MKTTGCVKNIKWYDDNMKELGYGKGYEKYAKDDLLPEKLKGKKYFTIDKIDKV